MAFRGVARRSLESVLYNRIFSNSSSCSSSRNCSTSGFANSPHKFSTWASKMGSLEQTTETQMSVLADKPCGSLIFRRRFGSEASAADQMGLIRQLRERTSAPMKDVKAALVDCNWDIG